MVFNIAKIRHTLRSDAVSGTNVLINAKATKPRNVPKTAFVRNTEIKYVTECFLL
jgi:hypothetical protein